MSTIIPPNPESWRPDVVPQMKHEILRKMNHGRWLGQFSITLQQGRQKRGAPTTPFLQGAVTRLQLAEQYIRLLEGDMHWLARDNKLLRKHIEHLGGVAAPPFRPDAEEAADPTPLSNPPDHDPTNPFQHRDRPGETPPTTGTPEQEVTEIASSSTSEAGASPSSTSTGASE